MAPRGIGGLTETLAFAAEGKVKADIELEPLSSINKIDRLEHGNVAGRMVVDFVGGKADDHKSKAPTSIKVEAATVG